MIQVVLSTQRRRPSLYWRRRFIFQVPTGWSDLGKKRMSWYRALIKGDHDQARTRLFKSIVPGRWRRMMSADDQAGILVNLEWFALKSDCSMLPIERMEIDEHTYHMPKPDGGNITCAEFAVCDDRYKKFVEDGDLVALDQLTAIIWREIDSDTAAANARGDIRVKFHTLDEADARIKVLGQVPGEMQTSAMLYFSGLKSWISRVYGSWIFEQPDEDEEGNEIAPDNSDGPNFGWWGILQGVAESGVFGTLDQVYQANLHEVCIFLVRKRQESDRIKAMTPSSNSTEHDDFY